MKKTPQSTLGPPIVKAANVKFLHQSDRDQFYEFIHGTCHTKMNVQFSATGSFNGVKLEIIGTTIAQVPT